MTNLDSLTELTEFAPLSSETKQSTVSSLLSKLFGFSQDDAVDVYNKDDSITSDPASERILETAPDHQEKKTVQMMALPAVDQYPFVLRRVRNLLALRDKNSPSYKDTNLKQYWMPDSISKECYDCNEKFTTFRRKHHCRVCGQIFCSRCCNQEVPGKILGCSGDLRVCTYCCKVVLTYLQSADIEAELSADLRALQDDLQSKFGSEYTPALEEDRLPVVSCNSYNLPNDSAAEFKRRKISFGYQEERFISSRNSDTSWNGQQQPEGSGQVSTLNNLIEQITHPEFGIQLQSYVYGGRVYDLCFLGSHLIDWLIAQKKTSSRTHSLAICQVLLDANYIANVDQKTNVFIDGVAVYHFIVTPDKLASPKNEVVSPSISENNRNLNVSNDAVFSQSVFHLDLNIHNNTAHISRMYKGNTKSDKKKLFSGSEDFKIGGVLYEFLKQNIKLGQVFKSNWRVADCNSLSNINDTKRIYKLITELFSQHIQNTVKQLLASEGLSLSWAPRIISLAEHAIEQIKLDFAKIDIFDIRQYVQIKTIADGKRENCCVIDGIVCTKNIAHRKMYSRLSNPRILLLQCAIVYQRIEGRLMSLEPVMLQEQEYLRHAVARIAALSPTLVLVQKNVSRIAQESLTELGITLVLNVKFSVLERIARCTNADIVTSVDAYVGKPQLGSCAAFYTKNFSLKDGTSKTLMFFEGCTLSHLGRTILLNGSSETELSKLKSVANFTNLLIYNSNLEKSFLLDEFAKPFTSAQITFLSDGNSPDADTCNNNNNNSTNNNNNFKQTDKSECPQENAMMSSRSGNIIIPDNKTISEIIEEKRIISKSVVDENEDPLHVSFSSNTEDETLIGEINDRQRMEQATRDVLALSEVTVSKNKFREALRDTILSISPLIIFDVPYLEAETGRNCELRKFFPTELYYSAQFGNMKNRARNTSCDLHKGHNSVVIEKKQLHPFLNEKLKDSYDSENVQEMLASFRACGNQYIYRCYSKKDAINTNVEQNCCSEKESDQPAVDILDPQNHQHIYILFCSFSSLSNNAPGFCVDPWVVNMDFYGQNDIPLGSFLTKYCFRESYVCPSKSCDTPMVDHEKRFVHGNGCVQVTLHEVAALPEKYTSQSIFMWSYCTQCKTSTPIVAMSDDSWGLSFAKYLELRFRGTKYICRAVDEEKCQHLLHRDFYQYFYHNNIIALFRYSSISLWKISFPPLLIKIGAIKYDMDCILDHVKKWSLMGHEVFSSILEKLYSIENDCTTSSVTLQGMKCHLTKQQAVFKQHVEEIQLVLSSLTSNNSNDATNVHMRSEFFKLEDSVVLLKKSVAQILFNWNALLHKIDVKKSKPKSSLSNPQAPEDIGGNVSFDEAQRSNKNVEEPDVCTDDCFEDPEKFWKRFTHIPFFDDNNESAPDDNSDNYKRAEEEKDHKSIFYSDYNSDEIIQEENKSATKVCIDHNQQSVASCPNEAVITPVTQVSDKFTVKTILSQLFFNSNVNLLPNPISPNEHYLLNISGSIPIVVYEYEPGSIIAYALSSYHYRYSLENVQKQLSNISDHSVVTRTSSGSVNKKENTETAFHNVRNDSIQIAEGEENQKTDLNDDSKSRGSKLQDHMHVEVSFSDSTANFIVKVYFAQQFAQLRAMIFPSGEDEYIRSLCRCVQWAAHGGKSGSTFCKTKDDRFVLKQMSRLEIQSFLEFAHHYFNFIGSCNTTNKPTLLGKIVGVYRVKYRTSSSSITSQSNLLVIENLFSGRNIARKFDLKGSVRNRLVDPDVSHEGELVLLDENLINMTCESPLYIYPNFKTILMQAINNDVTFLASQSVMDYSLLVGLDETKSELVVGIIDYIRTFTWDKKLETMVKKSGILGGQGKLPTIVSPEEYKNRFIKAMHKYFLSVPDQWYKCEKGCDY